MSNKTVYNALLKHTNTLFILNGLNQSVDDIEVIIDKIRNERQNTKIIVPEPKKMDIFWPDGEIQYDINSWYNYYSSYDNKYKHDIINKKDFTESTQQLSNLVNEEILNNPGSDISLCGLSQGGTIMLNYSVLSIIRFKTVICIDTIFMHSYVNFGDIKKNPVQKYDILISTKDEVYNPDFQLYCYNFLGNCSCNNIININYRDAYHTENFDYIGDFIISKI